MTHPPDNSGVMMRAIAAGYIGAMTHEELFAFLAKERPEIAGALFAASAFVVREDNLPAFRAFLADGPAPIRHNVYTGTSALVVIDETQAVAR